MTRRDLRIAMVSPHDCPTCALLRCQSQVMRFLQALFTPFWWFIYQLVRFSAQYRRWRRAQPRSSRMLIFVTFYLLTAIALDAYGQQIPTGQYDAIVVAGCGVKSNGQPSDALAARVRVAVGLWEDAVAPRVVFTGGVGDHAPSEAEAAARLAESLGMPRAAMVLEDRSTSTEENARFAADQIGSDASVLVVSSAYHVFRCRRVFARHFDSARGTGALERLWPRVKGAFREVTALFAYAVLGRL